MDSSKVKVSQETCGVPSKGYHICECYGHTQDLPEYRKLAVPRTLQGFHAKEGGGCPCIPKTKEKDVNSLFCSTNPMTRDRVMPVETYRAYKPGKHMVHKADNVPVEGSSIRDPATGTRLVFPNARNYGGTAAQRGFPSIGEPRRKTRKEREYEKMQDRKEFLKAVLRDEIKDHISAEEQLEQLENQLCLRGSRHAQILAAEAASKTEAKESDDDDKVKTVGEQYDEVMEELQYVTRQPVGSKVNLIRMYYLLEEQDRLKYHRDKEKKDQPILRQYQGKQQQNGNFTLDTRRQKKTEREKERGP